MPLFTLPPTCISWSPTGRYSTLACLLRETCCCAASNLPLGITNKGREAIDSISGAVAGDSSLQDRRVAHYLLPLLLSLVSLPFSFFLCVLYEKPKKLVATFCLCLSLPTDAIFTMGVEPPKYGRMDKFHLDRLGSICAHAKSQPTWLRENHWMSMLIIRDTAYLKKGNTYGTKYKLLIAMLSVYAT